MSARPSGWLRVGPVVVGGPAGIVSGVSDGVVGVGVEVVGQRAPADPRPGARVALEAAAFEAVAALEVADAALAAGAVAGQPIARSLAGAGGGAALAGDEQPLGRERLERLAGGVDGEAAVDGDLGDGEAELLELGDGSGQQLLLVRVAGCGRGRQHEPARPRARVRGDLGDLVHRSELGRLARLALA